MKEEKDPSQLKFQDIYDQEKVEINKRRQKHFEPKEKADDAEDKADDLTTTGLVGLALSGGGIRSATFSLGFLQESHRLKILRIFDYLSTVSGGGYVGGWWSAWLSREEVLVRAKEETPFFKPKDIRNVDSLIAKLRDSADEVSSELMKQMLTTKSGRDTKKLLEINEEGQPTDPKLVKGLADELNLFICSPLRPGAPSLNWPESTSPKPGRHHDEKHLWTNRIHLEHTYPYELRNIFPPKEQIEPQRKYAKENGARSEGSICAWDDPIHHLRLFANYLTPRKGMLSADTWRAVSVITRNLLLTWLILLPILTAVMLLGQAYFLFMRPAEFTGVPPVHISGFVALTPIAILLAFTVIMAIAWLLCSRDTTSSTDWIAQGVCFLALGTLLVSALWVIPSEAHWEVIKKYEWWAIVGGAFTLISVLMIWYWKINRDDLSGKDRETILRWKREVRRGRFSRLQTQLLVFTSIVAAVLFVSWLSCVLFAQGTGSPAAIGDQQPSFAWLPFIPALLSALGGSIFTALRTAPSAAIDKPASHKPSAISRFIFTLTPGLVVVVLAVLAAWFAHWLLYGALTTDPRNLELPLKATGFLLVTLFLGLAVYEMKDLKWPGILNITLPALIYLAAVMINASWLWQAGISKIPGVASHHRWVAAAILAFCGAIVMQRLIRGKGTPTENQRAGSFKLIVRACVVTFASLTVIGWGIGEGIFLYTRQKESILGALLLVLAALTGGAILYRLLTVRKTHHRYVFRSRFFHDSNFSKRPEWLWGLAAFSLIVAVTMLCLALQININTKKLQPGWQDLRWNEQPLLFPAALLALLIGLILFRLLVLQRPKGAAPLPARAEKFFDQILGKISKDNNGRKEQAFRLLAFVAVTLTILGDSVVQNQFANATLGSLGEVMIRADWVFIGVALVINLPLFGVSVFKVPGRAGHTPLFKFKETSWLNWRATFWAVALACVALALLTGYLLTNWLYQLSRIELDVGLTPLLLPVAAGCLLMIVFEVVWGKRDSRRALWLIGLAYLGIAVLFFIGLVATHEAAVSRFLSTATSGSPQVIPTLDSIRILLGLIAAVCVWIVSLGWMVDPNSVSMHQFYRARLVRAYLGASNIRRRALGDKEITDTVAGDDLPLKSLSNCEKGGPYHLINTTLNLVAGRDLATAQRSASSFILSQKYCGSGRTDYRPTDEYMNGQLSLGTAIAASGAAVSPNMGSKKPTAALAMLMTLLNVRLGYWAPTPNQHGWNSSQPRLWPFFLVREFLSQTNDLSSYCYLTDGGHFDNTGLYPLIERGCRFVVLVDCGADPQPSCFQDLGEAIRRCRIDFGTDINLNLDSLITATGEVSDRCFVVGEIQYSKDHFNMLQKNNDPATDTEDYNGIIVYVKPSIIENLTADVRQYSLENNLFPQQTTANQWFDEAQFESYRRLGVACANKAFGTEAGKELQEQPRLNMKSIKALFDDLRKAMSDS
jgi:hypothetical protein